MIRNTLATYGIFAKILHWVVFVLLFGMIIFGFLLEDIPKDYQPTAYSLHKLTGLSILLLMLLRVFWTMLNVKPLLPPGTLPWQRWAERTVHFLLYASVIIMPIAGWIGSCAAGRAPHLGDISFDLPVPQDDVWKHTAFEIHEIFAIVIIVLVSIHVAAALYHHFVLKDNVLRRML